MRRNGAVAFDSAVSSGSFGCCARVSRDHAPREHRACVALNDERRRDGAVARLRRRHKRGKEAVRGGQERALPKRLEERLRLKR